MHEPPHEVVLDDERARLARDAQYLATPLGREHGTGGVLEERLADEGRGARGAEGVGEQREFHAVGVHRDGHRAQPRGTGDGEHAGVGRRLDQDRGAGRGEGAQGGGERGLSARGDQHLGGGEGPADAAREPLAQLRQPFHGRAPPGTGTASGARQGGGHRPLRLQRRVQIAAVELDHAGRRGGQRHQHPGGVHRARYEVGGAVRAERDLLPGGVPGRCRCRPGQCAERARPGPGDHQPLGGELRQGPGHGHGAHPESLDKGPARRQLSSR